MMRSDDVLAILARLDAKGLGWWVAGGWAVDALAGEETRPHEDLDLVVLNGELAKIESVLAGMGFTRADESELPAFLILRDESGHQVDLYLVDLDRSGDAWQCFSQGKRDYFAQADLAAVGRLQTRDVRCLSAEALFRQFLGYRWAETARHDLQLLHDRCGSPIPPDMG
jgi:lincosamide nucleotidyltransferase A/C/D/E